jgi:hypothetical protein
LINLCPAAAACWSLALATVQVLTFFVLTVCSEFLHVFVRTDPVLTKNLFIFGFVRNRLGYHFF